MAKTTRIPLDQEQLRVSAAILRALAHPLRLRIVAFLLDRPSANVQNIYALLGVEQSVASQHLRVLRMAGMVRAEREGKNVLYQINEERLVRAGQVAHQLAAVTTRKNTPNAAQ